MSVVLQKYINLYVITHLSYPTGKSTNSYINYQDYTTHYQLFKAVLIMLLKKGWASLRSRADDFSSFRNIPIRFQDIFSPTNEKWRPILYWHVFTIWGQEICVYPNGKHIWTWCNFGTYVFNHSLNYCIQNKRFACSLLGWLHHYS